MNHEMGMSTKYLSVERGGVDFVVKGGGETIGTLTISNATISWYPRHSKKKKASFTWEDFDAKVRPYVK